MTSAVTPKTPDTPDTVGQWIASLPAAVNARPCGDVARPLPALTDDSRRAGPQTAFIAIPGIRSDGHAFGAKAEAAGAPIVIFDPARAAAVGWRPAGTRVAIDDLATHLPTLAAAWHGWPGRHLRLAGITGTNGKTTTAHLLGAIFRRAGLPHLRLGTTGNWLVDREATAGFTTPFPVELQALLADAVARGATHGVMEVSSHALAQGRARPLRYAGVALTSFSQDHLDFHPDMHAYLEAKCLLAAEHCEPDGVAIAPSEQGGAAQRFLHAAAGAGVERRWTTSRDPGRPGDLRVRRVLDGPGIAVELATPAGALELRSPLVGAFNLDNLMVVVGLALALGLGLDTIGPALRTATGAPGRLEWVGPSDATRSDYPAVYVDYAHTPDAVERALEALRPSVRGDLIVVLGCGGDRDPSKRPLMGRVASLGADRMFATSDNPRTEDPDAIVDAMIAGAVDPAAGGASLVREVDRARAIALAIVSAGPDDVVLIAGKGHEDYQILGTEKIHFDDREHAQAALDRAN